MKEIKPLNIFYSEPDPDRWLPFDRYPRRIIRRIYRGRPVKSGQYLVFYNLIEGLKKIGVPFRLNDYKHVINNPTEIACIIGRDHVLENIKWKNPIVFGSAFGINPVADPDIISLYPIKKLLVPSQWVKDFFKPYGDDNVVVWPVGLDTNMWKPVDSPKKYDFLIYDKINWDYEQIDNELLEPIKTYLKKNNFTFTEIKYGHYKPNDLKAAIAISKYAIFICEHETQGIAYQQILSSGCPILAWDKEGYWRDPSWYPHKIKFKPVTSVPYWDDDCGTKFLSYKDFATQLDTFLVKARANEFDPRKYILQNLTLEICAQKYADIIASIK